MINNPFETEQSNSDAVEISQLKQNAANYRTNHPSFHLCFYLSLIAMKTSLNGGQIDRPHPWSSQRDQLTSGADISTASSPISRFTRKELHLIILLVTALGFFLLGISSIMWNTVKSVEQPPSIYSIEVLNEFPHDQHAYTQGLLYAGNDTLFESTGIYGQSSVRRVDLQSGKVLALQKMNNSYFGEGLTLLGERLFQVTWLTNTGFIYDRDDLSKIQKFTHEMQDGWGLATDGKILFGSDGTSTLYQFDPQTSKVTEKHIVKYKSHEVHFLNELEFINDEVWANVYMTDCIARISHKDGSVVGWILLENLRKGLITAGYTNIDVLNGIAWDSKSNRLFVTGKLWPKLFEIKLHPINKNFDSEVINKLCIP